MRAQEERGGAVGTVQIERVHGVPRRMIGGNPERLEVVVLEFHLRPLDHVEPHRGEGRNDGPLGSRDRMESAEGKRTSRQTDVERRQIPGPARLQLGLLRLQRLPEPVLRVIQQPAGRGPPGGVESAERSQRQHEPRFAPQVFGAPRLDVALPAEARERPDRLRHLLGREQGIRMGDGHKRTPKQAGWRTERAPATLPVSAGSFFILPAINPARGGLRALTDSAAGM